MLVKTRGIVLHTLRYGDSSLIAHIYTESFGRQSFMIRNTRGKNASSPAGLLQPLFLVEMDVYHKASREMQHLKEMKASVIFKHIPYDVKKRSIALFLGEVLYKTLREEEANPGLFDFLQNSLHYFDLCQENISVFHILFLTRLSRYLGFFPGNNYSPEKPYFDLLNGLFVQLTPAHPHYLSPLDSRHLNELLLVSPGDDQKLSWNASRRKSLLDNLLKYYSLQFDEIGEIQSYQILQELFH